MPIKALIKLNSAVNTRVIIKFWPEKLILIVSTGVNSLQKIIECGRERMESLSQRLLCGAPGLRSLGKFLRAWTRRRLSQREMRRAKTKKMKITKALSYCPETPEERRQASSVIFHLTECISEKIKISSKTPKLHPKPDRRLSRKYYSSTLGAMKVAKGKLPPL